MKRKTAAVSGLAALVIVGSGTGMAMAYQNPTPHHDQTPAVTMSVRAPQPRVTTTARPKAHKTTPVQDHRPTTHVKSEHQAPTTRPATTPMRRHAPEHATAPQRLATSLPTVQRHHATVTGRATPPTRVAPPRTHHAEPAPHQTPLRHSVDGAHPEGSGHH